MNCLNQAIAEERIHQVRLLLSLNVDAETRDKGDKNRTPLLKAARLQCEDSAQKIMKILIKYGVNTNAADSDMRSALHYACNDGKCEVIKLLLKEDALKLNEFDKDGRTPLMLAALNGNLRAARIMALRLTKFDLDIDLRDKKGYTALLMAIKNQNYSIARDLICYANACSTLRDNEEFKNAPEWLKKTLSAGEYKTQSKKSDKRLKKQDKGVKTETSSDEENLKGKISRVTSAVPLLTISSSIPESTDQDTEASVADLSISGMVSAMKEAAAKSGLLFEPDPYRTHSRPPSSVLSKGSVTSNKNNTSKLGEPNASLPISEKPNTRPSTGVDNASVASLMVSQASKIEDLPSTTGRNLLSASSANKPLQVGRNVPSSRGKTFSARKALESKFKVDLGTINVPLSEYSYSHAYSASESAFSNVKDVPLKDASKNNPMSIQALKQALKNQKKNKISRSSTALSYSYPTSGNERPESALGPKTSSRPALAAKQQKVRNTSSKIFPYSSNTSMRSFYTQSHLTEEILDNSHLQAGAIEKAKRNIQTLFSLYTDSLLWTPDTTKPSESLIVQGNESDKMTLASELTTSASDLASLVERGSVAPSEDGTIKQESKTLSAKSRLMSATSKSSRRSARITSARNSSAYR